MIHIPLNDHLSQPNKNKILWTVCDSFDKNPRDSSQQDRMVPARTPNFDGLCRGPEAGPTQRGTLAEAPAEYFPSIRGLSALEIDVCGARPLFNGLPRNVVHATADDFTGVERMLAVQWEHHDLFVLNLDHRGFGVRFGVDLTRLEWVELLDAWLFGLLAVFQPNVFAMSGGIWSQHGAALAR